MMKSSSPSPGVGSPLPLPALLAALVALLVVGGGLAAWWSLAQAGRSRPLVLATGPETGAYHALGSALASLIEDEGLAPQVTVRATEGSGENVDLLAAGAVDLAIIQSDTKVDDSVRLITDLYEEAMHVLVSTEVADRISQHLFDNTIDPELSGFQGAVRRLADSGRKPEGDYEIGWSTALVVGAGEGEIQSCLFSHIRLLDPQGDAVNDSPIEWKIQQGTVTATPAGWRVSKFSTSDIDCDPEFPQPVETVAGEKSP